MILQRDARDQKGGKGGEGYPSDWRLWLKDLERRMDEYVKEKEEGMARKRSTEEIDVDDIIDEIGDEELDDAEELDADDDPTQDRPKRGKRTRKSSRTKEKASKKKSGEGGIGTTEVAEAAGTDPRSLRMLLRAEFPREEGGRYHWKSLNDPEVKKIIKRVREGGASAAKAEKLDELKERRSKKKSGSKKATTKKSSKKTTKTKADRARERRAAKKKAAEEEDDE